MDRNSWNDGKIKQSNQVALRKESVDRNLVSSINRTVNIVALRKESVDRNNRIAKPFREQFKSLSARRAWIEIIKFVNLRVVDGSLSARRAWIEICLLGCCARLPESLSARRAWIEISDIKKPCKALEVALRKESVDRNLLRVPLLR